MYDLQILSDSPIRGKVGDSPEVAVQKFSFKRKSVVHPAGLSIPEGPCREKDPAHGELGQSTEEGGSHHERCVSTLPQGRGAGKNL